MDRIYTTISKSYLLPIYLLLTMVFTSLAGNCAGEDANRNLALCVGINGYARMGALRYCVNDAHAIKSCLDELEYFRRVTVLTDIDENGEPTPIAGLPTANNIMANLKRFADLVSEGGTLLFYFSGHGIERNGASYLVPVDGDETTALALTDIKAVMATSRADVKLIILDACRSGLGAKGLAGVRGNLADVELAVLVSCEDDQFSYEVEGEERSLFSLVLEKALAGGADANGDGIMTGEELFSFMDLAMGDFCLDNDILTVQTPVINDAGREATFFRFDLSKRKTRRESSKQATRSVGDTFSNFKKTTPWKNKQPAKAASNAVAPKPAFTLPLPPSDPVATLAEQHAMGVKHYYGRGVAENHAEAVKWFRMAAEGGYAAAQNFLAHCYKEGKGVPQSYSEAAKWYTMAANQSHADAQTSLGVLYYKGNGVGQNYTTAAKWFRLAADQGNAVGQSWLGDCYYEGHGVAQSYQEAMKWYLLGAKAGRASDQRDIGAMYLNGEGVPVNYHEALKWFRLAAEQGNASAQMNLGRMYTKGQGVPINYGEAMRYFNLSAAQGNKYAEHELGHLYYEGKGVARNRSEGIRWFRIAADKGESCGFSKGIIGY